MCVTVRCAQKKRRLEGIWGRRSCATQRCFSCDPAPSGYGMLSIWTECSRTVTFSSLKWQKAQCWVYIEQSSLSLTWLFALIWLLSTEIWSSIKFFETRYFCFGYICSYKRGFHLHWCSLVLLLARWACTHSSALQRRGKVMPAVQDHSGSSRSLQHIPVTLNFHSGSHYLKLPLNQRLLGHASFFFFLNRSALELSYAERCPTGGSDEGGSVEIHRLSSSSLSAAFKWSVQGQTTELFSLL